MCYKDLDNRMKKFIDDVVSPNQSPFISRRYIQNNILLPHEVLHGYHNNGGQKRCVVKVDLRKAYDIVRLKAMDFALNGIGVKNSLK